MVEFHGRPFLAYLLDLLRDNGLHDVLLLLGYRAEVVERYLASRPVDDLRISTHVAEPELQTGSRMWLARDSIAERFLFLYSDNYWPMSWPSLWRRHASSGRSAQVTVYRNDDSYSRDNVRLDADGETVVRYDPTRQSAGLRGVEIGYAIMPRQAIDLLEGHDAPFERLTYPALIEAGELGAYVTGHRYYSVGSIDRLPRTEAFLARRPAVIVDRDGVLNEKPPRAQYVRSPDDLRWLPGAREALGLLTGAGYTVLVASNQAGVGRGAMSMADLAAVNARLVEDAAASGGRIDGIYFCPHDWDEGCECRKPRPGMLFQAQRDHGLDLSRTFFVGDDERDGEAAAAAGSPFLIVNEDQSLLEVVHRLIDQSVTVRSV
ncbi:HAD-IIIA family hydrolase [soil metagenome]